MARRLCFAIFVAASLVQCLEPLPEAESGDASGGGASGGAGAGGSAGASSGGIGGSAGTTAGDASLDTLPETDAIADSGDLCADVSPADYEILRLPAGETLNGSPYCSETFWATVPVVTLKKPQTIPSDNTAECKFAWSAESKPPVIWGCCVVQDKDVRGTVTTPDGEAYKDDGFELLIKGDDQPAFDVTAQKAIVSVAGGFRDSQWSAGTFDITYDANVLNIPGLQQNSTLNDSTPDTGYRIKLRTNVGFDVVPGQRARCDITVYDFDGVAMKTQLVAFGDDHTADMASAGVCRFSCKSP